MEINRRNDFDLMIVAPMPMPYIYSMDGDLLPRRRNMEKEHAKKEYRKRNVAVAKMDWVIRKAGQPKFWVGRMGGQKKGQTEILFFNIRYIDIDIVLYDAPLCPSVAGKNRNFCFLLVCN